MNKETGWQPSRVDLWLTTFTMFDFAASINVQKSLDSEHDLNFSEGLSP
jgi:hypothetical protein